MPIYRHQVTWNCINGITRDRIQNTFHSDSSDDVDALGFAADLVGLFTFTVAGQTDELSAYFGPTVTRASNGCSVTTYDLSDPTPRVPIATPITFTASTGSSGAALPREVALCVSFQGDPVSGTPQARRRGRVFLGGLNQNAGTTDSPSGDLRPTTTLIADCKLAFAEFLATEGTDWVVWSPTDAGAVAITNGWVDNAFDTMRKRGTDPTTRNVWS